MKNKDAIPRIRARLPFKGNNMFGETVGADRYAVYSYGYHFPMAVFDGTSWYINENKYSPSTTRHQSYVRQAVTGEEVGTMYLKEVITGRVLPTPIAPVPTDPLLQMELL